MRAQHEQSGQVTVVLLDTADAPSATLRLMATSLEQDVTGALVHVVELATRGLASGDAEAAGAPTGREELDRVVGVLAAIAPSVVAAQLTPVNQVDILEALGRVRQCLGGSETALWGAEAEAQRSTLAAADQVDLIIEGEPGPGLAALLRQVGCGAADADGAVVAHRPRERRPTPIGGRLDELARACNRRGAPAVVEPPRGGLPLHLHRHARLPDAGLEGERAAAAMAPLLRAGLAVRLRDPGLASDGTRLETVLRLLQDVPTRRLILELPVAVLTPALVEQLVHAAPHRLELDLGDRPHETLAKSAALVGRLLREQLPVAARICFGCPGAGYHELMRAVDGCLELGVDELDLVRLLVPPSSRLRGARGLRHALSPPFEVLGHAEMSPDALLRTLRFVSSYNLAREQLAGTGVLRAIRRSAGSAAEVLEGFGDYLASRERDPLAHQPRRPLAPLLIAYLRDHHGLDLSASGSSWRLRRCPDLSLRWLRDGRRLVTNQVSGKVAHLGRAALSLLDRFDEPRTLHEVAEQMLSELPPERRTPLRRDLQATVEKLAALGFLVTAREDGDDAANLEASFTSLDEFDYHYRMLADTGRVEAYRRAIESAVRPGTHAVEIGTGTGVLAVLAAKAGARVTAIEQYSVLEIARAVAQRNGVAERISFVQGRSDALDLDLEPRGDLLISEIVGNRILNEGLLEITLDARKRLLRPGAALIPQRIDILAEVGESWRFAHLEREFLRITERHGIDLQPVYQWFRDRLAGGQVVSEMGTDDDDFLSLTGEHPVISLDLRQVDSAAFSVDVPLEIIRAGTANAAILAFRLELQPGIELSTRGRHCLHWSKPVHMLPDPAPLAPGERWQLRVDYEPQAELKVALTRAAGDR